jgi:hypothetical protein
MQDKTSRKRYTRKPQNLFLLRQCPVSSQIPNDLIEERIVLFTDNAIPVETPEDFFKYNFGYDIVRDSIQSMTREVPEWELPATFFEKEPGAGVYP